MGQRMRVLQATLNLAIGALVFFAATAGATDTKLASPKLYFTHPRYTDVDLSPSGTRIAAIAPLGERQGLVVMDLAERKGRSVAVLPSHDIVWFAWVNERRLVFSVADRQSATGVGRGYGLYAVDHDGGEVRELVTGRNYVYLYVLSTLEGDESDDILIVARDTLIPSQWKRRYPDVFRLDTRSGRGTLVTTDRPGDPIRWLADRSGVIRAAVSTERSVRSIVWWRPDGEAPWRKIDEHAFDGSGLVPVAFDGDGSLIVTAGAKGRVGLYRYDTEKMALGELLASHPTTPLNDVVYDARKKKIVGVRYDDGIPRYAWWDDDWARLASGIDKALPNRFNALSHIGGSRLLVHSVSDTDPGSWHLLDLDRRKLEFLVASRPEISPADMPSREFVRYNARDGLPIPAYVTLPKGSEPKALPLVLLVHGGPWMRGSRWTWHAEAAYLASLGYAVLQPEFRGSLGWGYRHFRAGWQQWGLAMQDDLVDGIDWLAKRGTIDPSRVCIMGGSYGGYATMMGLARDPDRFRCGVNMFGVTDIRMMFTAAWSDTAWSDMMNFGPGQAMIGDPDRDAEKLKATSPVNLAASVKAPSLLMYGGSDVRVPVDHGVNMRNALRRHGATVEWIEYPEEAHGLGSEANRIDFYSRLATFLAEHLRAK